MRDNWFVVIDECDLFHPKIFLYIIKDIKNKSILFDISVDISIPILQMIKNM